MQHITCQFACTCSFEITMQISFVTICELIYEVSLNSPFPTHIHNKINSFSLFCIMLHFPLSLSIFVFNSQIPFVMKINRRYLRRELPSLFNAIIPKWIGLKDFHCFKKGQFTIFNVISIFAHCSICNLLRVKYFVSLKVI